MDKSTVYNPSDSRQKIALVTGATDGIGKETAIALASKGYSVQILGRNKQRGQAVLDILKSINPDGQHELLIVDLSGKKDVLAFLDEYLAKHTALDVLVLNAGVYPKKVMLSEDGIDLAFSVGFVSRYLFSIKLNNLLTASKIGKVVHINGSVMGHIRYSELHKPTYNKIFSVWQNSVAGALLVYFWKEISHTDVAHMHWNPGIVNTQTVKSQGSIVRFLSKLMGMIEPEQAGEMLVKYIDETPVSEFARTFYMSGKVQKVKTKISGGDQLLKELLDFAESFTGIR